MIRVTSFHTFSNDWRDDYIGRIARLIPFEWKQISLKRSPSERHSQLLPEEEKFLKSMVGSEFYLLDVDGKALSSQQFYEWCFKVPERHLVVGPAVGFHSAFKEKAKSSLSLSSLTFTHALAQTMLAESIYRSACMLKNHPFVK